MMDGIIIILGNQNDLKGNLSKIAKERLQHGIKLFEKNPNYKILLTGGFGDHFNKTKKAHAYYAKKYLIKEGVKQKEILEFALSYDTIQDALMSKPIVDKYKVNKLIVVSSDFHMRRVRYIFNKVFKGYKIEFSSARTVTSEKKMLKLKEHEKKALDHVKTKGLIPYP